MEKYAIVLDTKIQHYKDICSPQIDLQILLTSSQNLRNFFV